MNHIAYLNSLLESEEMQFYMKLMGKSPNPTTERIRNLPKDKLLEELELIMNKKSNLSRRERELVIHFSQKLFNK